MINKTFLVQRLRRMYNLLEISENKKIISLIKRKHKILLAAKEEMLFQGENIPKV